MEDPIDICRAIVSLNSDLHEQYSAWDRLRPWLATEGYDLYHYDGNGWFYPQHDVETEPDLFFPEVGGDPSKLRDGVHPLQTSIYGRVGFAQDTSFRHCALKLMETDSDERKILNFLHKNKEDAISNCVLPVMDFLEIGNYTFAIMPRWGIAPHFPWFSTVRQAATFIRDILKALSFLHKNYIVYQDIKLGNILVNHCSIAEFDYIEMNEVRKFLKDSNEIKYALCDFDSSLMLSSLSSETSIRLPSSFSWVIVQEKPNDTIQGEPDYDPFAFDVALLGIDLWNLFSGNVHNFHLLVPLVDKMITGKSGERFTAAEALEFVQDHIFGGSDELLNQPLKPRDPTYFASWDPDCHDKWASLPTDFVEKWGKYKAPKSSYRNLILRKICTKIYKGYEIVKFFRLLSYKR